jgi:hypothetical protein
VARDPVGFRDVQSRYELDWFKNFLQPPNDIPLHDAFRRVFARLDPTQFQQAFIDCKQR